MYCWLIVLIKSTAWKVKINYSIQPKINQINEWKQRYWNILILIINKSERISFDLVEFGWELTFKVETIKKQTKIKWKTIEITHIQLLVLYSSLKSDLWIWFMFFWLIDWLMLIWVLIDFLSKQNKTKVIDERWLRWSNQSRKLGFEKKKRLKVYLIWFDCSNEQMFWFSLQICLRLRNQPIRLIRNINLGW